MNVEFQCECGQEVSALGRQVGELIDCPTCMQLVQVPPRPGIVPQPGEEEPQGSVERRELPRISRAPSCKGCKTRLVPTATKEDNVFGSILGRTIFVVGLLMALIGWLGGSSVATVIFGLATMVSGLFVVFLLRETKMTLSCPNCQPGMKSKKMLRAS
jgi:hypothetical protein